MQLSFAGVREERAYRRITDRHVTYRNLSQQFTWDPHIRMDGWAIQHLFRQMNPLGMYMRMQM
jgi:hypothetical protein